MKKVISIGVLALMVSVGFANKNYNIVNIPIIHPDTTQHEVDEDELMDYSDSLISFPSYDLYCSWDTVNIHPVKVDLTKLSDTTVICLYDETSCGYAHPFAGKVTSNFGPRRKRYHYGIDIDLETGDPVKAAFDGKVRIVQNSASYGNVVVIRHNNGLETYYAHLSKTIVTVGQDVFAGDSIGLGGNTGRSKGSHLHFEVRYLGRPINPNEIISFEKCALVSDSLTVSKKTFSYVKSVPTSNYYKSSTSSSSSKSPKIYTVKKGDTLTAIAKRYGTTTAALCKKNGIKSTSILKLGQKIKI